MRLPLPRASDSTPATPARWTTAANSDTCLELERTSRTEYSTFPTRAECEAWVKTRHCRPGFRCFDGCNWKSCDNSGVSSVQTLAGCSPAVVQFVMDRGQSKVGGSTNWPVVLEMVEARLHAPQRKLQVRGYAAPDEAANPRALQQLARARAETVARELSKRGILRQRLVVDVGDVAELQAHAPDQALSLVRLTVLPLGPLRDDFEPSSSEYRHYCQE